MLVILSNFPHADDAIERKVAAGRCELFIQRLDAAKDQPIPADVRARADGIAHYPAGTVPDGPITDYVRVRAVSRSGVGFDRLDLEGFGRQGAAVFNVPDYGTSEVADHAIALMLALTRGTASYHEKLRQDPHGFWSHRHAPVVRRLRGAVFGVVGLGRIGLAAALRARGFGMDVAFHDPLVAAGMELAVGMRRVKSLGELMEIADVLSVHAPSQADTVGLIDAAAFARAKPGMIVVNTARGLIVDLDALTEGLKSGRIAAAGLDVTPVEPPDRNHPLIRAWLDREPWLDGRLTLSPHAAFFSPDSLVDLRTRTLDTVIHHLETGSLVNCVNLQFLKPKK
jgi:D-3-phosphoglycerate dehydrogenase/C-terminal binding protein